MNRILIYFYIGLILMYGCGTPKIEFSVAQIFSNHMVLQQDQYNAVLTWVDASGVNEAEVVITDAHYVA